MLRLPIEQPPLKSQSYLIRFNGVVGFAVSDETMIPAQTHLRPQTIGKFLQNLCLAVFDLYDLQGNIFVRRGCSTCNQVQGILFRKREDGGRLIDERRQFFREAGHRQIG